MTLPGTTFADRAGPATRGIPTDTGTAFFLGITDKGPSDVPQVCRNMAEWKAAFGDRLSHSALAYDSAEYAFSRGVALLWQGRVVGPSALVDKVTLNDGAGTPLATLDVQTIGKNASNLMVQVTHPQASTFLLIITDSGLGKEVERSGELASPAEAVQWGNYSKFVRVVDKGSATATPTNNPAVIGATALNSGTDDRANILDSHRVAALAQFSKGLGCGQIAVPGSTTTAIHTALFAHADANNRWALCDMPDTASDTTMTAEATTQRTAAAAVQRGQHFAPWFIIKGVAPRTVRNVPPSAGAAGLMAANDRTGSPNRPAAGYPNGVLTGALGLTRTYTDAQLEALNDGGVCMFKQVGNLFELYGYRTGIDSNGDLTWLNAGNGRLRMAIAALADNIAQSYIFKELTRENVSAYGADLAGMLGRFYTLGSLYGDTPDDAFGVDVGPTVNTPSTLEALQLNAVLEVAMTPFAERVRIELFKQSISG